MNVLSEWCSTLHVDESDEFFFDHPLDHVPGMLIFDTVARCVTEGAAVLPPAVSARNRIAKMTFRFPGFCEKDSPTVVRVRHAGVGDVSVGTGVLLAEARQDGTKVCSAELHAERVDPGAPDPETVVPSYDDCGAPALRAERRLVHKLSASNVLVTPLWTRPVGTPVIGFGADMPVPSADLRRRIAPTTLLVEGVRQLIIMAGHAINRIPLDWQYVITSLRVQLSESVVWAQPVSLRSHGQGCNPRVRGFEVEAWSGERCIGRIDVRGRALAPAVYRRLRNLDAASTLSSSA
jgi:2-oxo-3-(phosphooxy)propyl 3-oxoalkanoate synthase